jgi:ferritin-like metal-binding protein YciE
VQGGTAAKEQMSDIIDDVRARLVERVHSPGDLLAFKLGSALKMEHRLLWTLDALASEAESLDVKDLLHHHVEETQLHLDTIKRALTMLGAEADAEQPSPSIKGIDEDTSSKAKHAREELHDLVIVAGMIEIEHHEIGVYKTVVALAGALGQEAVLAALRPILEQEQRQLAKLTTAFQTSAESLNVEEAATDDGLQHKIKSRLPRMIESPRDLLEFNLGSALHMEKTVLGMLGHQEDQSEDGQVGHQLNHHASETRGHIQNLERAFAALGVKPQKKPCHAIDAIKKESKTNLKITCEEMLDGVILAGVAETEHYEIAVYEALIVLAERLGAEDALPALRENLEQEQHMLDQVSDAILTQTGVL